MPTTFLGGLCEGDRACSVARDVFRPIDKFIAWGRRTEARFHIFYGKRRLLHGALDPVLVPPI